MTNVNLNCFARQKGLLTRGLRVLRWMPLQGCLLQQHPSSNMQQCHIHTGYMDCTYYSALLPIQRTAGTGCMCGYPVFPLQLTPSEINTPACFRMFVDPDDALQPANHTSAVAEDAADRLDLGVRS